MNEYVQENSFTPGYSYMQVYNNAGYIVRFSVTYTFGGKTRTYKSSQFTLGQSDKIYIPNDAIIVTLAVEEEFLVGKWILFCGKMFFRPISKCYSVSGTTTNPKCMEIPCVENNGGNVVVNNCRRCCCKFKNDCNRY